MGGMWGRNQNFFLLDDTPLHLISCSISEESKRLDVRPFPKKNFPQSRGSNFMDMDSSTSNQEFPLMTFGSLNKKPCVRKIAFSTAQLSAASCMPTKPMGSLSKFSTSIAAAPSKELTISRLNSLFVKDPLSLKLGSAIILTFCFFDVISFETTNLSFQNYLKD